MTGNDAIRIRESLHVSQTEFGKMQGVSRTCVSKYETYGDNELPRKAALRLQEYFGCVSSDIPAILVSKEWSLRDIQSMFSLMKIDASETNIQKLLDWNDGELVKRLNSRAEDIVMIISIMSRCFEENKEEL